MRDGLLLEDSHAHLPHGWVLLLGMGHLVLHDGVGDDHLDVLHGVRVSQVVGVVVAHGHGDVDGAAGQGNHHGHAAAVRRGRRRRRHVPKTIHHTIIYLA